MCVQFRIAPKSKKIPKSSGTTTLQRLKAKAAGGSVKRSRTSNAAAGTTVTSSNRGSSGIGGSARAAGGRKFTANSITQLQRSGGGAGQWSAGAAATTVGAGASTGVSSFTTAPDCSLLVERESAYLQGFQSPSYNTTKSYQQQQNQSNYNNSLYNTNNNASANYSNHSTYANTSSSSPHTTTTPHNKLPSAGVGATTMMMTKHKSSLAERLNIGDEVRDLKLGCTYNSKNTTTAFHTIKCKYMLMLVYFIHRVIYKNYTHQLTNKITLTFILCI